MILRFNPEGFDTDLATSSSIPGKVVSGRFADSRKVYECQTWEIPCITSFSQMIFDMSAYLTTQS